MYELETNKLTVNVEKTKVIVFRKGGTNRRNMNFTYNGHPVDIVKKFSYLGITFTTVGSLSATHEALAGQALKAIYKLKSYLVKFTNIDVKHSLELFDKLVVPILNYGCEIWGFKETNVIERIHLQYCKQLLGVRAQTQNNFVYGELGRTSLLSNRLICMVRFWFKIFECECTKYIRHVYDMMLRDLEMYPNKISWAYNIKLLLDSLGFNHVWLFQGVGNKNIFIDVFKQRMYDNCLQLWNALLENSTRARTYKLFSCFRYQPYLDIVKITKFKKALTRLRVSSHYLEVEAGRWHRPQKISFDERKCRLCNTLEDEFHFLFECPLYQDIRQMHMKKHFWKRPDVIKFIELFESENIWIV